MIIKESVMLIGVFGALVNETKKKF